MACLLTAPPGGYFLSSPQIFGMWQGRPTVWQIACLRCPVHLSVYSVAVTARNPDILVLRSTSMSYKLQELVVQEGGCVIHCGARVLLPPEF